MSFVDGFFSFQLRIANADRGIFQTVWTKTPKHPLESLKYLAARTLAFSHCYNEGVQFSRGLFEARQPTIFSSNVVGDLKLWAQIGDLSPKKLNRALALDCDTEYLVYFFAERHIEKFLSEHRRNPVRALSKVSFHWIDPTLIEQVAELLAIRNAWDVAISDNYLFLSAENVTMNGRIEPIELFPSSALTAPRGESRANFADKC